MVTTRRTTLFLLASVAAASAVSGCRRDPRLKNLTLGISRDSALTVMGVEKPRRIDPFLMNGQYIEAMYYAKPGDDRDSIPDRKMSPVIVVDGNLAGWGWKEWDSIAAANKIVLSR